MQGINFLGGVKKAFSNVSSLFIFLWIYLILIDILSVINFGFNIEDIKYFFSFGDLLLTSSIITGFVIILNGLLRRNWLNVILIAVLLTIFLMFFDSGDYGDTVKDRAFYLIILSVAVIIVCANPKSIYENFIKDNKWATLIASAVVAFFVCVFVGTSNHFSYIYHKDNEVEFANDKFLIIKPFRAKFFTPDRLEKSYYFTELKISESISLSRLNDILYDDKLPYYGFMDKIWVWYLKNGVYKSFFIVSKDEFKYKLTVVICEEIGEDKYRIVKFIGKNISWS